MVAYPPGAFKFCRILNERKKNFFVYFGNSRFDFILYISEIIQKNSENLGRNTRAIDASRALTP